MLNASLKKRREAAERYRPERVKLLLVAEAPPDAPDRYFYFENVANHDDLFRYVTSVLFGIEPSRNKPPILKKLKESGVFLIDLKEVPIIGKKSKSALIKELGPLVPGLVQRCADLRPEHIIIIKKPVFDLVYLPLRNADLPVVNLPIAFPGTGQQLNFKRDFASALQKIGWV